MDAQHIRNPEEVSSIWVWNLENVIRKMSNTKTWMINAKSVDAIKLKNVNLVKSEECQKEALLHKD